MGAIDLAKIVREMWDGLEPEAAAEHRRAGRCEYMGAPISVAEIPFDRGATVELRQGQFYLLAIGRPVARSKARHEYHPDAPERDLWIDPPGHTDRGSRN